jgi:hypothetical protein
MPNVWLCHSLPSRSIIAMRSVKMDTVPADPHMARGEIFGGGWILEPVATNPAACTASYILNGLVCARSEAPFCLCPSRQPRASLVIRVESYLGFPNTQSSSK